MYLLSSSGPFIATDRTPAALIAALITIVLPHPGGP